jgi:transcriptional regulator with XRE-family HTH domain
MELQDAITDLLKREGISQKMLAERAQVSQATVSRALKREPLRRRTAYARLCRYMRYDAPSTQVSEDPVRDAVRDTWDGSKEHAAALAKLVLASRELWPTLGKGTKP